MAITADLLPHLSGFLQYFFVGLLVVLVGVVGIFFLFLVAQLVRNPARRAGRP
jgi:threonine/homoserine/homoserine lactone efflux protein